MSDFSAAIVQKVFERCQESLEQITSRFAEAFNNAAQVECDSVISPDKASLESAVSGEALVLLFQGINGSACVVIADEGGAVPDWAKSPSDAERESLRHVAENLGELLIPEAGPFENCRTFVVDRGAEALLAAGLQSSDAAVKFSLTVDGHTSPMLLCWPLVNVHELIMLSHASNKPVWSIPSYESLEEGLRYLPSYARSLLKIKVPVKVILAHSKEPVQKILEIGHGSLIQFEKACDETLTLEVGSRIIAEGEAVKVGEKFGLRVSLVSMPEERFECL